MEFILVMYFTCRFNETMPDWIEGEEGWWEVSWYTHLFLRCCWFIWKPSHYFLLISWNRRNLVLRNFHTYKLYYTSECMVRWIYLFSVLDFIGKSQAQERNGDACFSLSLAVPLIYLVTAKLFLSFFLMINDHLICFWQRYDTILQWGNCIFEEWSWFGEWRWCIHYILLAKDLSW